MSKKDYELLARVFRNARRECLGQRNAGAMLRGILKTQSLLISELAANNPAFDTGRFMQACLPR